jgi:nicotinate dehydrogenase subunit B
MADGIVTPPLIAAHPRIAQWVRLMPDGTVEGRTGRVELGQGNLTALTQIVADELDVPPGVVRLISGDTRETPNEGFTAGSLSIAVGGLCLRLAASALRQCILREAAALLQREPGGLEIRDGRILAGGMDSDLTLWSLADKVPDAAEVMADAAPKAAADRRVAGQPLARIDLRDRIVGAPFLHDMVLDGMLHGRPVHPPALTATLLSLDIAALAARRGVAQVVREGSFVGVLAAREEDAVAAAAWAKEAGQWSSIDFGDAGKTIAGAETETEIVAAHGDISAVEGAVHETTVTKPFLSHGSIGPSCAVALWDGDTVTVWSHCQGVFPLRKALAEVLGLPEEDVHVMHRPGSGCYGHNGADDVALDAALLARAVPGQPVRVVWSRSDEFATAPMQTGMTTRIKATVTDAGQIGAMRIVVNSGSHGNRPGQGGSPNLRAAFELDRGFAFPRTPDLPLAAGGGSDRNAVPLYDLPNLSVEKRLVHDHPYRTSSMRGLGAFMNVYAIETLMDDIAHAQGVDPLAFRLAHMSDPRARAVMERAAEMAGWPRRGGEAEGWGMGFARYKNTSGWCCVVAEVEVDETVALRRVWAAVDCGEAVNHDGIVNQIEGGIIQSASWTLKEAATLENGVVMSRTWEDYPILRFDEVPRIEVSVIDRPEEPMVGCGEAAQGPTAAAISNAVRAAPGLAVRVRDLPLTRDAIIAQLM